MPLRTYFLIAAVLLTAIGCQRPTPDAEVSAQWASIAELRLTCQSHHKPLQTELALVRAEQGLPKQIDAACGADLSETPAQLAVAFSPSQLKAARERTDELFAYDVSQWTPLVLERALQIRAAYDEPFQRVQTALASPNARLPLALSGDLGTSDKAIDAVLVYVRFELIDAMNALTRGDVYSAAKAIHQSLHIAELLADQPHVAARLTGATARREALGALQRLVNSFTIGASHLSQFEQRLSGQLAAWPSDANAWRGDQAQGLCVYEMIRDGQILTVLTEDELVEIRRDIGLEIFTAAVARNIDIDETHYLAAMREIIGACEKPFFERTEMFERLEHALAELRQAPDYPIVADRYLLTNIRLAQRQQAADLALVQAWNLALAVACGASLPPPQVNPLTGENFDVTIAGNFIVVRAIDPLQPELHVQAPIASPARFSNRQQPTPAQPR